MTPSSDLFAFERLEVYRYAIGFLALAIRLVAAFPRGHAALADQLRRAAVPTPLNIAEGAGRSGREDAKRHYAIARGSAMECAAIVDACAVMDLVTTEQVGEARALLLSIVRMLTRMCR